MKIKQKLIGFLATSLIGLGVTGPLLAVADGSPQPANLTSAQISVVQSISSILTNISAQVQLMAATRSQESALIGQMAGQLAAIQIQLQQGNVTPSMLQTMSVSVSDMSMQVSRIAARRAQENQILAALPPLLNQILAWLKSL